MNQQRIIATAPWTAATVAARLRETVVVLSTAPGAASPASRVTYWPDTVPAAQGKRAQQIATALALMQPSDPDAPPPKIHGSPDQITRLDETLAWLSVYLCRPACAVAGLPSDAGWLVWARASGWSYARIGKARKIAHGGGETRGGGPSLSIPWGNARPSLMKIERAALDHLATQLNRTAVLVDQASRAGAMQACCSPEPPRQAPAIQGVRTIAPERGPAQYDLVDES